MLIQAGNTEDNLDTTGHDWTRPDMTGQDMTGQETLSSNLPCSGRDGRKPRTGQPVQAEGEEEEARQSDEKRRLAP